MKTEAELRMAGMQALINALGLVEAERFVMAVSREPFDYTAWRRDHLPRLPLEELAKLANLEAEKLHRLAQETNSE
ncbi:hypothetical protein EYB53_008380 [Candidatus Chloroploca sp. M-50]|uniref:Uncharacterized protein n=1 Tax=Candidatus Chloroploca mongolica TaxID=2528176 RepID=A0ABS4D8F3_9CHLR|nr:hypothetical protein [Candidatus Chloroploca mongolica]MBP1465719.1 hypothetical protein [Candidatus Chloroploca mongolica]